MPPAWELGKDYVRGGTHRVGDLVAVARSDGTLRFGEVLASAGAPGGRKELEICVAVDGEGRPDTMRVELAADVFRPAAAGAPARGARLGSARRAGERCAAEARRMAEDRRLEGHGGVASAAKVAGATPRPCPCPPARAAASSAQPACAHACGGPHREGAAVGARWWGSNRRPGRASTRSPPLRAIPRLPPLTKTPRESCRAALGVLKQSWSRRPPGTPR